MKRKRLISSSRRCDVTACFACGSISPQRLKPESVLRSGGTTRSRALPVSFEKPDWPLFRDFEAFAALFAVAVQRVEDDGIRFRWGAYLIDLDGLAFELFVILKKATEHEQAVGRHFRGIAVGVEFGIFGRYGDDF